MSYRWSLLSVFSNSGEFDEIDNGFERLLEIFEEDFEIEVGANDIGVSDEASPRPCQANAHC